jgi:predicted DNA-binding protein
MTDIKYTQHSKTTHDVQEAKSSFQGERKKFATQMDAVLLERLRSYAKSEGRQIQAILEDAVEAFLKDKQGYVMDPKVKAAYLKSIQQFDEVYKALAK